MRFENKEINFSKESTFSELLTRRDVITVIGTGFTASVTGQNSIGGILTEMAYEWGITDYSYDKQICYHENLSKISNKIKKAPAKTISEYLKRYYDSSYSKDIGTEICSNNISSLVRLIPFLSKYCVMLSLDPVYPGFYETIESDSVGPRRIKTYSPINSNECTLSTSDLTIKLICPYGISYRTGLTYRTSVFSYEESKEFMRNENLLPSDLSSYNFLFMGTTEEERRSFYDLCEGNLSNVVIEHDDPLWFEKRAGYTFFVGGHEENISEQFCLELGEGENISDILDKVFYEVRPSKPTKETELSFCFVDPDKKHCQNSSSCEIAEAEAHLHYIWPHNRDDNGFQRPTSFINVYDRDFNEGFYRFLYQNKELSCAFILGASGSGKSRLAYELFRKLCEEEEQLWTPYFFRCPHIAEQRIIKCLESSKQLVIFIDNVPETNKDTIIKICLSGMHIDIDKIKNGNDYVLSGIDTNKFENKIVRFVLIPRSYSYNNKEIEIWRKERYFCLSCDGWSTESLKNVAESYASYLVKNGFGQLSKDNIQTHVYRQIDEGKASTPRLVMQIAYRFCKEQYGSGDPILAPEEKKEFSIAIRMTGGGHPVLRDLGNDLEKEMNNCLDAYSLWFQFQKQNDYHQKHQEDRGHLEVHKSDKNLLETIEKNNVLKDNSSRIDGFNKV